MTEAVIRKYIKQGEGKNVEFKSSLNSMPSDLFETVCAFLNRNGGIVLLGVDDNGKILGIDPNISEKIINDIVTTSNNPNKLNPPFLLFPGKIQLNEGLVIYIRVPESSQVHKCDGKIFDRSEDGDFVLTNTQQISELYIRKSTHYTEGKIYPKVKFEDFNKDLFPKVRNLLANRSPSHLWLSLSNEEIIKISGLKKKDYITGEEGYTLAAILLFGKDDVIQDILPHYKIEMLVRINNLERYDDRLQVMTNLIDAYDLLMKFIEKHLPDKFFMEGDQRVSLRERIFREVIANLIIHREYTNAHIATICIFNDRVELKNANKPYYHGKINPNNFSPIPKNPLISKFFLQLGRVEEIGSGILNVQKYLKFYSPDKEAEFIDDDIFMTTIPIPIIGEMVVETFGHKTVGDILILVKDKKMKRDAVIDALSETVNDAINVTINGTVNVTVSDTVKTRLKEELIFIVLSGEVNLWNIIKKFRIHRRTALRDMALLKQCGLIEFKGAPKIGKYVITEKLRELKIKKKGG
ncbi:MAG: RNA-binding domain-containing protein [candidate division WOR-3 bacterium]